MTTSENAKQQLRLPRAHIWYANVFEPRVGANQETLQYDCLLVWDKDDPEADLGELKRALVGAAKERWGQKHGAKMGLKDGDKLEESNKLADALAGKYFANASTRYKPTIVTGAIKPITSDDEFYSGCYAIPYVNIYTTDHPQGGRRVSLGLLSLQRAGKGERLGTGAVDPHKVFEPIHEEHQLTAEEDEDFFADEEDDDNIFA